MSKKDQPAAAAKSGGRGAEQKKTQGATTDSSRSQGTESTVGLAASLNPAGSQGAVEQDGKAAERLPALTAGADQERVERAMAAGVTAVRVTAPHDGYRRAGRAWMRSPVHVPLGELSDQQMRHLVGDPGLTVTPVHSEQRQDSE